MMGVLDMRRAALALLLAAAARADDGASAPPSRWSHARGPASNSGISQAEAPESFGRFAWTYKAKEQVAFPPVVWDGIVFVVDGSDLVAVDAATGQAVARIAVKAPGQPVTRSGFALVVEEGKRLVQFRLAKRKLTREWTFDGGAGLSTPRAIDREIYATTPTALLSLRVGMSAPVWTAKGSFTGEPAVRDGHVYALRGEGSSLALAAYAREDGAEAANVSVGEGKGAGGRIAVGNLIIGVLVPPDSSRTWAILSRKFADGKLTLGAGRTEKLLVDPIAGNYTLLSVTEEPKQWCFMTLNAKDERRPLADAKKRPELFEAAVAPVWLGESRQCYGPWCGDPFGNDVVWHASERPEGAPLRKGLRFHAVPAGPGLLMFVPSDGKSIVALAAEEIR
jgi:hypothetical protein